MPASQVGPETAKAPSPVFGLWMLDRWAIFTQVVLGAFAASLLIVRPFMTSDPSSTDVAFGVLGALVLGLTLGASQRDLRMRRMVKRHVEAVHDGAAVATTAKKAAIR
jgi:hypothetical protein